MPGIDSSWMAEIAGSGATADALAGVLGVLPGEGDEQPAAALTTTHPVTTATRSPLLRVCFLLPIIPNVCKMARC